MMERMADFSHILTTRPDFDDEDREWLHHLVADWQVIADLSFADLLLILQNGEGKYIIAEQCRPSTVMSLRADDVVGDVVDEEMSAELDAAMASESVFRSTVLRTVGGSTVCNVYAPVRHNGKTLGLVVRETNMATRESNGRYESESISAGKQLYEMIPRDQFPYRNPIMNQRHNARVADGFIVLTVDGIVRYASPNAISCFRRLGSVSTMQGEYLSEIGTKLLRENDPVLETLPLVLSGKAAVDSELDANKSAVSMRSILTQADISHNNKLWISILNKADCPAHNTFLVICLTSDLIFMYRYSKKQNPLNSNLYGTSDFFKNMVERILTYSRH